MLQVAVFVDAGYFFAQGSKALTGQRYTRSSSFVQVAETLDALRKFALDCTPGGRLLRIYWYDGAIQGRLSSDQEQLAGSRNCKVRLGLVNSAGEQKGVDSLIVTDLIELARNRAITDAVLLAGDEDLRIGVQIAQSFGVQVHLLGMKPARGSQSLELIKESDTHHEWDEATIGLLLRIETADSAPPIVVGASVNVQQDGHSQADNTELFQKAISDALEAMLPLKKGAVLDAFRANPTSVPTDLDRTMLPRAGQELGRHLTDLEKRTLRSLCQEVLGSGPIDLTLLS